SAVVFGGNITPTGTVTFKDGTATLGTAPLSGGTATLTTSALSIGSHSITAVYGGDGNSLASTSQPITQIVQSSPSGTAVASSLNPATTGQPITFTATVTGPGATGTV